MRRTSPTRAATATSTGSPSRRATGDEAVGRDELEVLGLDVERAHRRAPGRGERGGVALAGIGRGADGVQPAPQGERAVAVGGGQADVAARQREAVGLADRRADLDPDRDVEIAHERGG